MPLMEDAFGSRSGLNCAIGVLDGTVVGDAMVRDCVHIARPGRVMRWDLTLQRGIASTAIGMESWWWSTRVN